MNLAAPAALVLLLLLAQQSEVTEAIKRLKSTDAAVRLKGAEALNKLGADAGDAAVGPLCDALADRSKKVSTAALEALEKLRPDLHKPLTTFIIDESLRGRARAVEELTQLGPKAAPAAGTFIAWMRLLRANPQARYEELVLEDDVLLFLQAVAADAPATTQLHKAVVGANNSFPKTRGMALSYLVTWAGTDAKRRKEVLPLVSACLNQKDVALPAIEAAGNLGADAKSLAPSLKRLKLSSVAAERTAATEALKKVEGK